MAGNTLQRNNKPLTFLLIKPAGPDCNLRCDYCFYLARKSLFPGTKIHRMGEDILANLVEQALSRSETPVTFCWQGGEPTLMGLDFFKKAASLQERYAKTGYSNSMQTNGILIDRNWAQFFFKNHYLIGLSLDGPQHIHDRRRKSGAGVGSWKTALNRVKILLAEGVDVNALCVVNSYSVEYPEEIYDFFKSIGIVYMQFIPCLERDAGQPSRLTPFSMDPEKYGIFLVRLFDLWRADFKNKLPTTFIRLFDSLFYTYVGMTPPDCHQYETCGNYLVVEHNGDVFPCDFYVEPARRLGNIRDDTLLNMLNSKQQEEFGNLKKVLPAGCAVCPWLAKCFGGCPRERGFNGDSRNILCGSLKRFFAHADDFFKELAKEWKRE